MDAQFFFPYHEPSLKQILTLSSFLVFLNGFRVVGDRLANVGILGELFVGMIYGAPLADILLEEWESTFTALGYVGLIILVLEGGLTTNLTLARKNVALSSAVALTGLLAPILLSLIILHLAFGFSLLQAFTVGAALSTTSLGTTFSVISQAGFADTRLGAVLTSAAIADDVVGLILLQVIVSLGDATRSNTSGSDNSVAIGWAIGRPALASLAMLAVSFLLMRYLMVPLYKWLSVKLQPHLTNRWHTYNLLVALLVSSAYCAVASLSGTSILLGAFVAGLVLSVLSDAVSTVCPAAVSFEDTYEHNIRQMQLYLLRPLFFASIGYAIPIRSMFSGRIVWQGVCYTLVAVFSKLICGCGVILQHTVTRFRRSKGRMPTLFKVKKLRSPNQTSQSAAAPEHTFPPASNDSKPASPSLLPVSTLLGSAMVARGEISLLILNLAREASPELLPDDLFYIAIWATLLCTIIGPLTVGILVKRMKRSGKALPAEWGPVARDSNTSDNAGQADSPQQAVAQSPVKKLAESPTVVTQPLRSKQRTAWRVAGIRMRTLP